MKWSRRELSIDMIIDWGILKINRITFFALFYFYT